MVNRLREVDLPMGTFTTLCYYLQKLVCALLYDRLVAGDGSRCERGCPMLATSIVYIPILDEEQPCSMDLSWNVSLAL